MTLCSANARREVRNGTVVTRSGTAPEVSTDRALSYRRTVIVDQFRLSGAWNFRDLGGLWTDEGRAIKPGVLFRSSELCALDDGGRRTLLDLGVTDVVDLRGAHEVAYNGPDALPEGVALHAVPVHDRGNDDTAPHEQPQKLTPDIAEAALEYAYTRFPALEGGQIALAHAIRLVADSTGGVLIHCAAGKDRAGWITAALLRAAGVSDAESSPTTSAATRQSRHCEPSWWRETVI